MSTFPFTLQAEHLCFMEFMNFSKVDYKTNWQKSKPKFVDFHDVTNYTTPRTANSYDSSLSFVKEVCSQADSSRLPHPRFGYSETQGAHDWSQSPCPPFWTPPVFNRGGLQITSCPQACCLSCPTGPSCAHTCVFLPLGGPAPEALL